MKWLQVTHTRLVCSGLAGFAGLLSTLPVMAGSMVLPGGAGIYTERGNSLDVSYSEIHDNGTGVFLNSVLSSSITYTTFPSS